MSLSFRSRKISTLIVAALGSAVAGGTGSAHALTHHRVLNQQDREGRHYVSCDPNERAWYDRFNAQDLDPTLEMRAKDRHPCR